MSLTSKHTVNYVYTKQSNLVEMSLTLHALPLKVLISPHLPHNLPWFPVYWCVAFQTNLTPPNLTSCYVTKPWVQLLSFVMLELVLK